MGKKISSRVGSKRKLAIIKISLVALILELIFIFFPERKEEKKPAYAAPQNFVTTCGGNFCLNGEPFYVFGVNYWPSFYNLPDYQITPDNPNEAVTFFDNRYYQENLPLLERELQDLQEIGFNVISVYGPVKGDENGVANFKDFLNRAKAHNLRVSVLLPHCDPIFLPAEGASPNCGDLLLFDKEYCLNTIKELNLQNEPALFGYEIAGEPGFGDYATRISKPWLQLAWEKWIEERYGTFENAKANWGYDDISQPTDYQMINDGAWTKKVRAFRRFLSDFGSKKYGEMVREIKAIDPNHLISAKTGFTRLDGYSPFDLRTIAKHFDYIGLENYSMPIRDDRDPRFVGNGFYIHYAKMLSGGKPVVFLEFGSYAFTDTLANECKTPQRAFDPSCYHNNPQEKQARQREYYENFYNMTKAVNTQGVVNWFYAGKRPYRTCEIGEGDTEITDMGIREVPYDRSGNNLGPVKLVYERVRYWSWFFAQGRENPPYNDEIIIDVDAHSCDFFGFYLPGAEEYANKLAQGKFPAIKTEATGKNSLNVPSKCVGNTPYNFNCPHKYLNAEFNFIEIKNSQGEWQRVKNNDTVYVERGRPILVRASVGNIGEVTWLAESGIPTDQGEVQLGGNENDGSIFFRIGIANDVPPGQDANFNEVAIYEGITNPSTVVFQMSSAWVAWFGEKIKVTLVPTFSVYDLNEDGAINVLDLKILSDHWLESWSKGDFNHDGKINGVDFQELLLAI